MMELTVAEDVADALRALDLRRVGIDGIDGSGKSTLAKSVAAKLNFRLFHLDEYLEKNHGRFLDFLDYGRLRADVLSESHYVIEGVCLLHALGRARVPVDGLIYVKRYRLGHWADEGELEVQGSLEEFLH